MLSLWIPKVRMTSMDTVTELEGFLGSQESQRKIWKYEIKVIGCNTRPKGKAILAAQMHTFPVDITL